MQFILWYKDSMKKLNRLLKEPAIITAGKLKVSVSQAYRIKDAIEAGAFIPSSLEQARLLYIHYNLTPNDVIDYGNSKK